MQSVRAILRARPQSQSLGFRSRGRRRFAQRVRHLNRETEMLLWQSAFQLQLHEITTERPRSSERNCTDLE